MSGRKSVVRVTIGGDEYPIRSDASPEHTRAVAHYVDTALREVLAGGSVVESHKAAILAALQITDELFSERAAARDMSDRMLDLAEDVRRLLPPAKRGDVPA